MIEFFVVDQEARTEELLKEMVKKGISSGLLLVNNEAKACTSKDAHRLMNSWG